jgi:hypothetical protein
METLERAFRLCRLSTLLGVWECGLVYRVRSSGADVGLMVEFRRMCSMSYLRPRRLPERSSGTCREDEGQCDAIV